MTNDNQIKIIDFGIAKKVTNDKNEIEMGY